MTSKRHPAPAFLLLGTVAALYSLSQTPLAGEPAPHPNILLIVADDLGYSDLGCYGGEISTPNLDRLAGDGVRMTQFYTTARCCPSRASALTGHYPHNVGLGHMTKDIGHPGFRGKVARWAPTIAEVLAPAGYRSFLSGKWHLGTKDPTRHGFEEFYGTLASAKTFWDPDHFFRLPKGRPVAAEKDGFYGTDALTDQAIAFLDQARETPEKPWFLYLAYHAPHFPLHARREDIEKYCSTYDAGWDSLRRERLERMKQKSIVPDSTELSPPSPFWNYGETRTGTNPPWESLSKERQRDLSRRMAIYAAMVDRMDQNIGRLTADLEGNGELDNTLILFLSDNGACAEWDPFGFDIKSSNQNILHEEADLENMGQPGSYHSAGSGWASVSNTPFRLYKHFCHEGGILSPCIVHWPAGIDRPGTLCRTPAHLVDLLPTALEAAGADYPAEHNGVETTPPAGTSLLGAAKGVQPPVRSLFFEHERNRGVRRGQWKLVALKSAPWELYDLESDPTELDDLSGKHPEIVQELAAAWERWGAANKVTPLPDDLGVSYLKAVGE